MRQITQSSQSTKLSQIMFFVYEISTQTRQSWYLRLIGQFIHIWETCIATLSFHVNTLHTHSLTFVCMCMFVCISASISSHDTKYDVTACTWTDIDISCDYGRPPAIEIVYAQWGRMKYNMCPTKGKPDPFCYNIVTDMFSHR